jgi:hypothetical protein
MSMMPILRMNIFCASPVTDGANWSLFCADMVQTGHNTVQ